MTVGAKKLSLSRDYIRHPSDIPIRVVPQTNPKQLNLQLNNVSVGGLCVDSPCELAIGTVVKISINLVKPVFKVKGIVQWCENRDESFVTGIEFIDSADAFQVRMVEQICHIEHYRRDIRKTEGRKLSSQKAALEWIELHGAEFPNPPVNNSE